MNSKNITIILIITIVLAAGYFLTMNMRDGAYIYDGPKISLDRALHDFGVVPQHGGKVETTFVVKNDGTKTLKIGELTTSCSCTSAKISQSEIPAGEEAELTVIFDPDLHDEPLDVFKRKVFIPTNDPNNSEMEVAIKVDIDEEK